jgi:hypothetical protein
MDNSSNEKSKSVQECLDEAVFFHNSAEIKLLAIAQEIPIRRFECNAPLSFIQPSSHEFGTYSLQLHLNAHKLSTEKIKTLLETVKELGFELAT